MRDLSGFFNFALIDQANLLYKYQARMLGNALGKFAKEKMESYDSVR